MILVLGGTTEAKQLLERLIEENRRVLVSTAYEFAADYIPDNPLIKHISGRRDSKELELLIRDQDIEAIVDATHPYALEISKNAKEVCKKVGIEYIRLERSPSRVDDFENASGIYHTASYDEAANLACELGKVIFLATGSNNAGVFKSKTDKTGCKIYIRVLPDIALVEKCIEKGFSRDEIVTGVGPFSYEDNYMTWRKLGINVVVTKDSGAAGGFAEKVRAAGDLGIEVIVVDRPAVDDKAVTSIDEVIGILKKLKPNS